jgi:DNA-binding NarL/FixJ family response regulator
MFPGVRIVILTDYDDPGLRSEAQRAGASDYFLKEDLSALRALLLRDIS